jgi:cytochrome b561
LPVSFNPLILAHVAGGVLILALVVWRLVLKSQRAAPPPPDNEPALLRMVAHWSLYGLLAAMSMSGMAAWFGGVEAAATAHGVLKVPLIALIALHLLAVIFHHLILRNPILKRMV